MLNDRYFECAWKAYPSKIGKKAAKRHYRATVKFHDKHVQLMQAMETYIKFVKKDERPWQDGSRWFNNWQDWVHFEAPKKAGEDKKPIRYPLQKRVEEELIPPGQVKEFMDNFTNRLK